ncbi:hypothetical protein A5816_001582 [Enterococcus sp. 3G1_DIV0629]|uniref:hypothetical protein n=1 Tax=Enterococcus sp. (strain 3G1_DIV0629) TaxID=1834176 RepID=UPI000B752145|nr:hypothetical protein [Enterococcus sp. 3G1_DIV0629]OTO29297.1 hypothetical protein A5816_001582 [Enterococcus sp. 3G1_DIV0629]
MKELILNKENILDLLDCVNAWIMLYGYENMRPEMKELTSKLLEMTEDLDLIEEETKC